MGPEAERLVIRYYLYAGIYTLAASIIWGINTLFLLDAGLSIGGVFIANSAFSAGTMLFEIPTGVVADTIGRRASFLLSLVVLALTTLAYVGLAEVGGGLVAFSAVSVVMGLGFTFYSGAMEAWLVDGVRHHGYDGPLDRIFARAQTISSVSMIVGTIGGGLVRQIDLALPFIIRAGLPFVPLALPLPGMRALGVPPRPGAPPQIPAEANAIARAGIGFGWRQPSLRLLILATAVQMGFFGWAWYAWQPYFLELLDRDAVWIAGVVAALLAMSMIVGNAIVQYVTQWCGRRTTLFLWSSVIFSAALIGVGWADSFGLALAMLLVAGVTMGVQRPVRQAFIHEVVPSEQRATVVSFDSMISGGGGVMGQSSFGVLSDRRGFSAGYVIGGLVTLGAIPFLVLMRRREDPADFFAGSRSTEPSTCAPTGLPGVMQVESEVAALERQSS